MLAPLDFPLKFEPCFWRGRVYFEVLCVAIYIGTVYIVVSILHIRQFDLDRVVVKMYSDISRVSSLNQLTIP